MTYDKVPVQEAGLGQDRTADPAGASVPWMDQSLHSGMTGFILIPIDFSEVPKGASSQKRVPK